MNNSFFELLSITFLFLVLTAVYYIMILGPRDEMRYQVIDCMGADASQEAYRLCFEELRTQRASPS